MQIRVQITAKFLMVVVMVTSSLMVTRFLVVVESKYFRCSCMHRHVKVLVPPRALGSHQRMVVLEGFGGLLVQKSLPRPTHSNAACFNIYIYIY